MDQSAIYNPQSEIRVALCYVMFHIPAPDFSLQTTLESGQTFRWRAKGEWYYGIIPPPVSPPEAALSTVAESGPMGREPGGGIIHGCAVRVKQDGATLTVETIDPRLTTHHIRHYFALDLDLSAILTSIDVDAQIHAAITRHRGLRILRQDPWECLAGFICSSYNNIARIQGMIERLCQTYGVPVAFNGFRGCTFPMPETLARVSERRLRELGLGFRAGYLKATAKMVADGKLPFETLRRTDYVVTKASLRHCPGVGDKVADCVALFGLEKYEAFPIDVWIARAMRYYFRAAKMTPARTHDFARTHFGRYAGFAQQYLYHSIRTARLASRVERIADTTTA